MKDAERRELSALASARNVPQWIVLRARIVLGAADGMANHVLARQLSTSLPTVLLWRRRFQEHGVIGVFERSSAVGATEGDYAGSGSGADR